MNLEEKQSICESCPLKINRVCMIWRQVAANAKCPEGAFENPEVLNRFKKIKSTKVIKPNDDPISKTEIEQIFFNLKKGVLPRKYIDLKKQYIYDKKKLGKGCAKCKLNALINSYKNKIANT